MRLGRIYHSLSFAPSVFLLRGALRLGPGTLSPSHFARGVVSCGCCLSVRLLCCEGLKPFFITPGVNRVISGDLFPTHLSITEPSIFAPLSPPFSVHLSAARWLR